MRTTVLALALTSVTLSCGASPATPTAQTTTYVDGNLTGISPNTGGTLTFDDDKAMHLHTGLTTVDVAYAGVSHAELGAVKENSHSVPFYKVWARHRSQKTETQLLVVNFKNDQGEDKTMTLELEKSSAEGVLADLESRTGEKFVAAEKPAPATQKATPAKKVDPMATGSAEKAQSLSNWWGDSWWKTDRNSDKWAKPAASGGGGQQ